MPCLSTIPPPPPFPPPACLFPSSPPAGAYVILSVFDKYYRPNMSLPEALEVVDKCIAEVRLRLVVAPPNFLVKIVDKDGARELEWRRTLPPPPGPDAAMDTAAEPAAVTTSASA